MPSSLQLGIVSSLALIGTLSSSGIPTFRDCLLRIGLILSRRRLDAPGDGALAEGQGQGVGIPLNDKLFDLSASCEDLGRNILLFSCSFLTSFGLWWKEADECGRATVSKSAFE